MSRAAAYRTSNGQKTLVRWWYVAALFMLAFAWQSFVCVLKWHWVAGRRQGMWGKTDCRLPISNIANTSLCACVRVCVIGWAIESSEDTQSCFVSCYNGFSFSLSLSLHLYLSLCYSLCLVYAVEPCTGRKYSACPPAVNAAHFNDWNYTFVWNCKLLKFDNRNNLTYNVISRGRFSSRRAQTFYKFCRLFFAVFLLQTN